MNNRNTKKAKLIIKEEEDETRGGSVYLDDNVLSEVLRHVDARSLAMAGCVSKQWQKMARDERLWELICTKQWVNTGCAEQQLRVGVREQAVAQDGAGRETLGTDLHKAVGKHWLRGATAKIRGPRARWLPSPPRALPLASLQAPRASQTSLGQGRGPPLPLPPLYSLLREDE
ncbi:F-box protein GID2 [Glycine soja]|uniref:F-box protein n=1 Tax=Glycine soja TaxID=3848 RepID=A0A0B2QJ69_GLYSO|nr:F-box protein GID2 [Glycine soja]